MTQEEVKRIAREFHDNYERLAHGYGWKTQVASRTSYERLPEENRNLMEATVRALLTDEIIEVGPAVWRTSVFP